MTLAGAAAIAAAAAVGVFALAFALFALVAPALGPAGGAAVVAVAAALSVILGGVVAARQVAGRKKDTPSAPPTFAEKVVEVIRARPLLSAGAGLAAGLYALKNPLLVTAIVNAFLVPGPRKD